MKKVQTYWNERMETLSTDEFHAVQSTALLKQLVYVEENSAFYREQLIFSSDVALVKQGTLPKYEYKAKFLEKNY